MKKIKLLAIVPLILMLSSCVGEEPNNIAYVTALGIDKTEENYMYTIQFANPMKISGGASEQGGSGGQIVEHVTLEAPTLYSAINSANSIISKNLSLAHAKVFVVSEEMAAEGLEEINDVFSKNNDIRPDIYIAVAEDAGKYIEEVKPVIELNPVRYYQLTYGNRLSGAVPQDTATEFYMSCISGDRDCVLPLAGVASTENEKTGGGSGNQGDGESGEGGQDSGGGGQSGEGGSPGDSENKSGENTKENKGGFESGTKDYTAGQMGRKIENKSETLGMAVFKGDKYVGKLGITEAQIYSALMGNFRQNNITFYTENANAPVTIQLEEKRKPSYKVDIENKHVDIRMLLEGDFRSVPSSHKREKDISETEETAAKMITETAEAFLNTVYKEMNADVLGIKGETKRKFFTVQEYNSFCESFNPSEWSFTVNTTVKIRSTGMTYYD